MQAAGPHEDLRTGKTARLVDTCLLVPTALCDRQLHVPEHSTQGEQEHSRGGGGGMEHTVSDSWASTWEWVIQLLEQGALCPLLQAVSHPPGHMGHTWAALHRGICTQPGLSWPVYLPFVTTYNILMQYSVIVGALVSSLQPLLYKLGCCIQVELL